MKKDRTKVYEFLRYNLGVPENEYKVVFREAKSRVLVLSKVKINIYPIDLAESFREFTNWDWVYVDIIDNIERVEFSNATSI